MQKRNCLFPWKKLPDSILNCSILPFSVTADKWVPIIEVPVSNMKAFLEKKRQEGFSILGLEQTANSTPLDQYSFPTKTVCSYYPLSHFLVTPTLLIIS